MAVPFEHFPRDVPRQRSDRFLAHDGIFSQPGDEGMTAVMPPVRDSCGLASNPPSLLPLTYRLSEVHAVEVSAALITGNAD
jgi:hypothetical protein